MRKKYLKIGVWILVEIGVFNNALAQNNPLDMNALYTADPTARNWTDHKMWIYTSHDVPCMSSYSAMNDWRVLSSTDGVNWEDYGSVLSLDKLNQQGWSVYNAWAPDCVKKDGGYYFYFPVKGIKDKEWKIGVASSKNPQGPFENPELVVSNWGIDPNVFVDDDERAYLYCQFKMGELNNDMLTVKEETVVELKDVAEIPNNYYEGPFVFKRKDKYYYVCSSDGYKRLIYYMSDKPLGPWEYKGSLMAPDEGPAENNHGSVVKYKGKWVLFYHRMECNKARKICADYMFFNTDGSIQEVNRTDKGIKF